MSTGAEKGVEMLLLKSRQVFEEVRAIAKRSATGSS